MSARCSPSWPGRERIRAMKEGTPEHYCRCLHRRRRAETAWMESKGRRSGEGREPGHESETDRVLIGVRVGRRTRGSETEGATRRGTAGRADHALLNPPPLPQADEWTEAEARADSNELRRPEPSCERRRLSIDKDPRTLPRPAPPRPRPAPPRPALGKPASRFCLSTYPTRTHFRATHICYLVMTSPSGTVTVVRKSVRSGLRATYRLK